MGAARVAGRGHASALTVPEAQGRFAGVNLLLPTKPIRAECAEYTAIDLGMDARRRLQPRNASRSRWTSAGGSLWDNQQTIEAWWLDYQYA